MRGVSDGALLESADAETRQLALTRIRATGATVVRIPVDWRELVSPSPPPGFDPTDPSDRSYHFDRLDEAVRSAVAAGAAPTLVVSHAPPFAEAPGRWPFAYQGSWAPDPQALQAFAQALARRYDGAFPDPRMPGQGLPQVKYFQAWNEPNLARYLEPQWVAERRPLERVLAAALPAVAQRLLRRRQAGGAERRRDHRRRRARRRPGGRRAYGSGDVPDLAAVPHRRRPPGTGPVSGTAPLRRARIPPVVGGRPQSGRGFLAGRVDRRRRQGHAPAAARRGAGHGASRRSRSRCG